MNLTENFENGVANIVITGNIKTAADGTMIKTAIKNAVDAGARQSINLRIEDSFIITSSVIGLLLKFISKDKLPITIYVKNEELYEMIVEMSLQNALNVRKVS